MIRSRYCLASLLAVLTLTNAAKAVDKEKLRQAVSMPRITLMIGYGVNGRRGFMDSAEVAPEPAEIAGIEKELKDNATDAERYSRLANLYSRAGQPAKGKEALLKAVALYRKQLEQHPDDSTIQLHLADALDYVEKSEEAEILIRRVVKEHSNDWHAWLALGGILDDKSLHGIIDRKSFHSTSPEALLQSLRATKPTPEKIAASQQYRREAVACFDRAVSLAPGEAEVYRRRGASRHSYGCLECALRLFRGEKAAISECAMCVVGRDAIPDLRRAIDLSREEYKGTGMVVFAETMADALDARLQNPSAKPPKKLVDVLSESTRKRVLEDIACLETGTRAPDKSKAAEAAEVLGAIQLFLFSDESAAEKNVRRSLELDPKREPAWDLLCNCLVEGENYQKLAADCRERLAHKDSARNRLLLAKAYYYLHQLDKAEEVVRAGFQHEPNDFMLRLALADLLLMRADKESLRQAGELLFELAKEKPSDGGSDHRLANYTFAVGIYYGLIGEREKAQKWLRVAQKHKPDYPGIKDALKALEE